MQFLALKIDCISTIFEENYKSVNSYSATCLSDML